MERTEALRALDSAIANLHRLKDLLGDGTSPVSAPEQEGRYLRAPVWPWFAAGWVFGMLLVLLFVLAWSQGRP